MTEKAEQAELPFPPIVDEATQAMFDESSRVCRENVASGLWNRLAFTKSEWKAAGRDPLLWKDAEYIEWAAVNGRPHLRCYAFIEAP